MRNILMTSLCGVFAATGIAFASPAFSQTTVGEVTVTGSLRDLPRVSRAVSYVDLDLTTAAGQDELKSRVKNTAKDLCKQLGEANLSDTPLVPSCEKDAWNTTQKQLNAVIASGYKPPPPPIEEAAPPPPASPPYTAPPTTETRTPRN